MFKKGSTGTHIISVRNLTKEQEEQILTYLQGLVYAWCNTQSDSWFSARDFLGGKNHYWQGTPMIVLYDLFEDEKLAGQAAGKLLKKAISRDQREFETRQAYQCRQYRWTGN